MKHDSENFKRIFGSMVSDARRVNLRGHELVDETPLFKEVKIKPPSDSGQQALFLRMMRELEKHYVKNGGETIEQSLNFDTDEQVFDPLEEFFDKPTPYNDAQAEMDIYNDLEPHRQALARQESQETFHGSADRAELTPGQPEDKNSAKKSKKQIKADLDPQDDES